MPLAEAYRQRSTNDNTAAALEAWSARLKQHWQRIHFGNVTSRENENGYYFEVQLYLDDMDVDAVSVELYADSITGTEPLRQPLSRGAALAGSVNAYVYSGQVATDRPVSDYTPRVIPAYPQASIPLEANLILWHR
jgi:starch phosphorylase